MNPLEQKTLDEEEPPPDEGLNLFNLRLNYAGKVLETIFPLNESEKINAVIEEVRKNPARLSDYALHTFLERYPFANSHRLHDYNGFFVYTTSAAQRRLEGLFHTNHFFTNRQSLVDFGQEIIAPLINLYYEKKNPLHN